MSETPATDASEQSMQSEPDMADARDLEAIIERLEAIDEVVGFECGPTDRETTLYVRVEITDELGTYYLEDVIRGHDLRIQSAHLHALGHLKVKLVPFEWGGPDA